MSITFNSLKLVSLVELIVFYISTKLLKPLREKSLTFKYLILAKSELLMLIKIIMTKYLQ